METDNLNIPSIPNLVEQYFTAWSSKDIDTLRTLLADNCVVKDWDNHVVGKENVLEFNQNFFNIVGTNTATLVNQAIRYSKGPYIGQEPILVFCELEIVVDNDSPLKVVDLLTFDLSFKISEIQAYKQ